MISTQEMLLDILAATSSESTEYKSIQEMVYEIWQCIEVDEETGERFLKVKVADE